jgi:hypothetical protein
MTVYTHTARFDTARALTEDELRKAAPSIFATAAHESRSDRFQPIPTIEILRGLMAEGFMPVGAKQSGCRDEGKKEFTKHLIRLRRDQSYDRDYGELELVRELISQLNAAGEMDRQIAKKLNDRGIRSARGRPFTYENVWLLRHRWGILTAKINGVAANPPRWPDGTYSVQGAAAAIGVTAQTIFDYLAQGLIQGRQSTKGQPWQISLSSDQIEQLQRRLQRTRRSRKGAS